MDFIVEDMFVIKKRGTVLMLQAQTMYSPIKNGSVLVADINQQLFRFVVLNLNPPPRAGEPLSKIGVLISDSDVVGIQRSDLIGQTLKLEP